MVSSTPPRAPKLARTRAPTRLTPLSFATARRHGLVRKERRQLLRHPARARAQPAARLCQRRVSPRLLERRAKPAAAAAATTKTFFVCAAPAVATTAAGHAATILRGACTLQTAVLATTHAFQSCPRLRAQDAEACIPLPRLADFGLDLGVDAVEGAPMEERASCLFVRRIAEERRRASACFSRVASPDPPYESCHSNHKPFTQPQTVHAFPIQAPTAGLQRHRDLGRRQPAGAARSAG